MLNHRKYQQKGQTLTSILPLRGEDVIDACVDDRKGTREKKERNGNCDSAIICAICERNCPDESVE